ncbi:hypothetical protein ACS60J_01445 [Streptococcus suis]
MAGSKILKAIELFREEQGIKLATKNFLEQVYKGTNVTMDQISGLVDDEDLENFVELKIVNEASSSYEQMKQNLSEVFQLSELDIEHYFQSYMKAYYLKIAKFFNELILVILSLIIPTVVQLYFIDKFSVLSAVWLTIPITIFSLIRESNIMDFLALKNNHKGIVIKDYFRHIFKGNSKNKALNILLTPFYLIRWLLTILHSFIFQYKFQLLFYSALLILLTIGYRQVSGIFTQQNEVPSQAVQSSSTIEEVESKKEVKSLVVAPVAAGETIEIETAQEVSFPAEGQDTVTESENLKEYSYTAPITGNYYLELVGLKEGSYVSVEVLDEANQQLESFSSGGTVVELDAGKVYTIKTKRQYSDVTYSLKLTLAKETKDISKATLVKDSVTFAGQTNVYSYIAPREGLYHLGLTEVLADAGFSIYVLDSYGKKLEASGNSYSAFYLKESENYTIGVRHQTYSSLSSYTLNIGVQKPLENITNYTLVKDSIEFTDQVNHYTFTAPRSGVYGFELTDKMADAVMSVVIKNRLKEKIGEISSYESAMAVTLEKDEEYSIFVYQEKEVSDYSLKIGYASDTRKISLDTLLSAEMTFTNEVHTYQFIPDATGSYSVSVTNDVASLLILDEYHNQISGDYRGTFELEKGKKYTIQLTQDGDFGEYDIEIVEKVNTDN